MELKPDQAHVRLRDTRTTWCGLPILFGEWVFPSVPVAKLVAAAPPNVGLFEKSPCPLCMRVIARDRGGG